MTFFRKNKKWKRRDIIFLLERLEMYLFSGLEINKALLYSEEGLKKKQKIAITNLRSDVESGILLSNGLQKHVGLSKTISGLIEYGELSGTLAKSLLTSKTLLEKEDELFKKCTGAMIYPVIIGIFTILLTIGLMKGVMSQIIPMLKSLNVTLPLITRIVIRISEIITNYGLYIAISLIGFVIFAKVAFSRFSLIRSMFHKAVANIPIIGKIIYNYYLALFLHSCGSLVETGLSVKDAYSKIIRSISYIPLQSFLLSKSVDIQRGLPLGSVIYQKRTPSYIKPLLNAGEASGTLGLSIIRAGNIVDREIEHTLKKLTSLIEPIMMIGMGCIVGSLALSIMLPIYDISGALQR